MTLPEPAASPPLSGDSMLGGTDDLVVAPDHQSFDTG